MAQRKVDLPENKMGVMPIRRLLITMSAPMMISMLVQALYNIVDSMFVAQINENALTAVSLAFPLQNLMIAVAAGTGVGINALLSRSLGEKNAANANKAACNGIYLALLSCLAFVIFGFFGVRRFFEVQTQVAEITRRGREYLTICCVFSGALFGQVTFERLLQSTGKTVYSMITQALGAITNIILDPILIFGYGGLPRLGVAGAAVATVIGQALAMLVAIYFNLTKNHEINLKVRKFHPDGAIIRRIYAVGVPSIIMVTVGSVMVFGMNKILLTFTSTAVAVFGVYFKLHSFVFMPIFGLNNGMVPILAYNLGAKKKARLTGTIKLSIKYAILIMLIGLAVFQLIPDKLLLLFNASQEMLTIGIPALRIISISYLFAGFCIVAGSVFQALGNGFMSLIVSVARQMVVLLPAAYLLARSGSVNLVWWAFPIAEIASLTCSGVLMKRLYDREIRPLAE
ncbi:MAG: MATE family efflux transporter [Bacillota bacterium]|jgi:putative MATE family efflux protein